MRSHPVLEQLAAMGVRLGLERVRSLLTHLGEPQLAYPVVHIAGTNGKGSVCAIVTRALIEAGYRVGTYASPHLEQVNERVAIDGVAIDDAQLIEAIEGLDRARWDWSKAARMSESPLTYYEFMTVLAFLHFAQQGVDVVVLEVGLGGRLDATNVVQPLVCAITSIGLDHTSELGSSLAAIAGEKAGIFKRGVPVVLGNMADEARVEAERVASLLGSEVWRQGKPIIREVRRNGEVRISTSVGTVGPHKLGMQGAHQVGNAAVAVGVLHQLHRAGMVVPNEAIGVALEHTRVHGRIERILPTLVVDGAHNVQSAQALAAWLATQPREGSRILLWGMGEGRDAAAVLAPLAPHFDEVVTSRCAHPKARDPMELAQALQDRVKVLLAAGSAIEDDLPEVYGEADEVVVAGSLFMAGAARSLVASGALEGIEPGQGAGPQSE